MIAAKHLGECILNFKERSKDLVAFKYFANEQWQEVTWNSYYNLIEKTGEFLLSKNLKPTDRVAIISQTRYEWAVTDLAVLAIQGVTVPIYANNTQEDIKFILNNSESKIIFVENKTIYKKLKEILADCPSVVDVVSFETIEKNILTFDKIQKMDLNLKEKFVATCRQLNSKQMASILYTSGTTGQPKGVVLLHECITSEVGEAFPLCGVSEKDISLAFLPFAHILGRVDLWGHVYMSYTMAYAESIEKVRQNLIEIQPTILVSVPRIFEKIYSAIVAEVETQRLKKQVFDWALSIGFQVSDCKLQHQPVPLKLALEFEIAKKLVLNKVLNALGGKLRFAISGGAPISKEIAKFFHACNVLILEGYGLTETTAAIFVNTPFNYKFGSVGRPIGDVKVKIAEDGEILVKSKKIMKEYYNNPEATNAAFVDGWFMTGDIGELSSSGDLKITDRKKDLIKTAGGKYVAPQKIESFIKLHPVIGHCLIHGDQKKFIVTLLTLDKIYLKKWAEEKNLSILPWEEFIQREDVKKMVKSAIADVNSHLASYESIKKYHILPIEFSIEGGELTPSLKVKRKFLDEKYKQLIDSLYQADE